MVDVPSTLTTRALLIPCQQSELLCLPLITCPPPFPSLVSNVSSHHSPSSHSSFSAPNRKIAKAPGTSTEPLLFSLSASNLSAHPIPYRQILVCRLLLARQAPSVAVVAPAHDHSPSDWSWSSSQVRFCRPNVLPWSCNTAARFQLLFASLGFIL